MSLETLARAGAIVSSAGVALHGRICCHPTCVSRDKKLWWRVKNALINQQRQGSSNQ